MWSWAAPPYGNTPGSEVILRALFADVFFEWVYNNNSGDSMDRRGWPFSQARKVSRTGKTIFLFVFRN